MGQTLAKIRKGDEVVEAQYDTDMGNGSYYLYEYDAEADEYPPTPTATFKTKAELLKAYSKAKNQLLSLENLEQKGGKFRLFADLLTGRAGLNDQRWSQYKPGDSKK